MKRKRFKGITLIALMAICAVVYFEACKKEIITPINNTACPEIVNPEYTDKAKSMVKRVNRFKSQLIDKENVMRSGLCVPVDSVIWDVEALFNAEYTCSENKYLETVKQEMEFVVNVNENNEVPFGEVADLYDNITESVRQLYSNDGINYDKSLKAVVVDKGNVDGNIVSINVFVVSGRVDSANSSKDPVQGPFGPGDCWYFGEYGGTCDDPSIFGDAAEIIEDTINYYYGNTSVPQTGFRNMNFGMLRVSLEGNEYVDSNGEPYIYFYGMDEEPPVYLNYEMLNYYYTRELEVLLHLLPSDLINQEMMPDVPAFIEVDISGMLGYVNNGSYFHHKNYVIYGHKYPVPEQELPPLRDLLN